MHLEVSPTIFPAGRRLFGRDMMCGSGPDSSVDWQFTGNFYHLSGGPRYPLVTGRLA